METAEPISNSQTPKEQSRMERIREWDKKTSQRIKTWTEYWFSLFKEIVKRLFEPMIYPTYVIYFLVVIVAIGGLGFWIPYFSSVSMTAPMKLENSTKILLAKSLATYFLAIVATAFADLSFTLFEKLKDFGKPEEKKAYPPILSLWSFAFMTSVIVIGIGGISLIKETNEDFVFNLSCLGAGLSLFLWWIINYDNKKLKESNFEKDYNATVTVGTNLAGKGVENAAATTI